MNQVQYTTFGLNKTLMIVGLGNPGSEYDLTRHNIGFAGLDYFVAETDEMGPWESKPSLKCHLATGKVGPVQVIAVKPATFMNLSGEAVSAVKSFYKTDLKSIAVIHDELDIPFGQIRLRLGGSSAGHNGIKSISEQINEDYYRVRVGIGPKQPDSIDSAKFVLAKFTKDEQALMTTLKKELVGILNEYIFSGELNTETRSFLI